MDKKERERIYYLANKKNKIAQNKAWKELNKEKVKGYKNKYYEDNKCEINTQRRNEYVKKLVVYSEAEKKENKRIRMKEYIKKRKLNDPLFKLKENIRRSVRRSITDSGYNKNSNTINILGCSIKDFKTYLESKFESWMNWENKGKYNGEVNFGWDIDHIIPISGANSEEEILLLNHYTNLQPLCSYVNRVIKRGKST